MLATQPPQLKNAHHYTYTYVYVHPANGVRLKDLRPSTDQLAREQRAYKAFSTIMKSPPIFYRKGCNQSRTPLAQSLDKTHTVGFPTPPSFFGKNQKKRGFFFGCSPPPFCFAELQLTLRKPPAKIKNSIMVQFPV